MYVIAVEALVIKLKLVCNLRTLSAEKLSRQCFAMSIILAEREYIRRDFIDKVNLACFVAEHFTHELFRTEVEAVGL